MTRCGNTAKGGARMSRRYDRRHSRETKGHGAIGFLLTFVLLLFVGVLVFFFVSDTNYKGTKGKVYKMFYQQQYGEQVHKYATEFGVEEPLVFAVIRTESGFRPEVESSAGALGLMQLMPNCSKSTATVIRLSPPTMPAPLPWTAGCRIRASRPTARR